MYTHPCIVLEQAKSNS